MRFLKNIFNCGYMGCGLVFDGFWLYKVLIKHYHPLSHPDWDCLSSEIRTAWDNIAHCMREKCCEDYKRIIMFHRSKSSVLYFNGQENLMRSALFILVGETILDNHHIVDVFDDSWYDFLSKIDH